jgi:hypothetical protein
MEKMKKNVIVMNLNPQSVIPLSYGHTKMSFALPDLEYFMRLCAWAGRIRIPLAIHIFFSHVKLGKNIRGFVE